MAAGSIPITVPDEFAQHRRWRAFRDPSVEARYRAWHRDEIIPVARVVGIVSALVWASIPLLFLLVVGTAPLVLLISAWAISLPLLVALVLGTYTRLARWANEAITLACLVIGLNFIWVMSSLYGTVYGTVPLVALAMVYIALAMRLRTWETTFVALALCGLAAALLIVGTLDGQVRLEDSWPYIAVLLAMVPVVILASAQTEAGMRKQFAAQSQLQTSQRLLRRYAPAAVAGRIESGDAAAVGQPQRLRVTAMSSDVAGFTALADQIDPESLSHIINEYMATMSDVVEGQGGVVTEFAGDGLMAIFGAPEQLEPEEQVRRAMSAAQAMHTRLAELSTTWFRLGIEQPLRIRIGINTGMLSVGTFGSDGRATYTAIGLQMNVAARIQAQCEPGSTLLSSSSWHLVKDEVPSKPLGEVTVKGVHFPISMYAPHA
ncbi:MAG: adenylate/guanylate cyclase domain-containing protein [Aeromicrobium sp.]